jgi:hypothetical protein
MAKAMHDFVISSICLAMQEAIISNSCDEVTTIYNQSWILTHVYVVKGWRCLSIFLTLFQVLEGSNVDNLTKVIVDSLLTYSGISESNLASKLVCFGVDGVTTFQGPKTNVITQLKKNTPFMLGVHCVTHQTNLVVQTLYRLTLVTKIKLLL